MANTIDLEPDWPRDKDHLFVSTGSPIDARVVDDPDERFYRLPMGYQRAAEILLEEAIHDPTDRHNLVYPVVFCYRQAIELHLKKIIGEFGQGKTWSPKNTHELDCLWERFMCIANERGYADTIGIKVAQKLVEEMHKADRKSDGFRYPTNSKGDPFGLGVHEIDLEQLRQAMSGLVTFFDCAYEEFSSVAYSPW